MELELDSIYIDHLEDFFCVKCIVKLCLKDDIKTEQSLMDLFPLNLLLWCKKLVSEDLNGKKCQECLVAKPNEGLICK